MSATATRILRDPLFAFCLLGAGCFVLFDDARLRSMLVEKKCFLLADLPDTSDDSDEAELIEYYVDHLARSPATAG